MNRRLIQAVNFAANAHINQRRKDKDKTPYINHPIQVMYILSQAGIMDDSTLCAAVLHDVIEDTKVTYEELVGEFGKSVADIVKECSDDKSLPKEVRKQEQIKHAKNISRSAKLVKIADKISNLSDLEENPPAKWTKEEIEGYFIWSYCVWLNLKGENELLDHKIEKIFYSKKLFHLTDEELEKKLNDYYDKIKESK